MNREGRNAGGQGATYASQDTVEPVQDVLLNGHVW